MRGLGAFLFCAVVRGQGAGRAFGMFLERQGERRAANVYFRIDAEHAVDADGKVPGFFGIARRGRQGVQREGVGAYSEGC